MNAGFEDNFADFNRQMALRADTLGRAANIVLREQAGFLARTLIQISGPRNLSKSKNALEKNLHRLFGEFSIPIVRIPGAGGKHGNGDIYWYDSTSTSLYGIAEPVDKTRLDKDEVYDLYKELRGRPQKKGGMTVVGKRGKQTVKIWEKFTIAAAQMRALYARLASHFGRRQAGWIPAWRSLGSPSAGLGPVPKRVLDHEQGARGNFENGLGSKTHAFFTLINSAKGSSDLQGIVSNALKIRAKAMAADLKLYINGTKRA